MRAPDPSPPTTRSSFWRFVGRHRLVVAALAVVGMLAGALYGLLAPSTYTAQSLMLVGTFEVPANAVPGYVLASQTVAGTYARFATSSDVLDRFATNLGVSVDDARGRATATAVPESAVIRITATSSDADEARAASEAMTSALDAYVDDLNSARTEGLLQRYKEAQERYIAADQAATLSATAENRSARDLALAEAQGLENQFQTDQQAVSSTSQIRTLGSATVSEESKGLKTLVYVVVGLVVGAGLGLGIGWLRDRSARRPKPAVVGGVDDVRSSGADG